MEEFSTLRIIVSAYSQDFLTELHLRCRPAGSEYYYVGTFCNLLRSKDLAAWEIAQPERLSTVYTICAPNWTGKSDTTS